MRFKILAFSTVLIALSSALTIPRQATPHSRPHRVLHEFPNGTWVENIAVRANNELLVTLLTTPNVYAIDPSCAKPPRLVHSFTPSLGVLGITEVQPDHFYIITSNFSITTGNPGFGQATVHSLIFSPDGTITTEQIAVFPTTEVLNGISTLSASQGLVVLSDTLVGTIWLLNINTGQSHIILSAPELSPPKNPPGALGINGLRVVHSPASNEIVTIYFVNDGTSTIYSIPFSLSTFTQVGPIQTIKNGISVDDFAASSDGQKLYLAASTDNSAIELDLHTGETELLLGGPNSTVLPGPTSAAVSRRGRKTVFYTTNGGVLNPVNGVYKEGGKVVAIDLE